MAIHTEGEWARVGSKRHNLESVIARLRQLLLHMRNVDVDRPIDRDAYLIRMEHPLYLYKEISGATLMTGDIINIAEVLARDIRWQLKTATDAINNTESVIEEKPLIIEFSLGV